MSLAPYTVELDLDTDEWDHRALCGGMDREQFFPERGASSREARAVCRGCDVRVQCREYAITHVIDWGIWGGTSAKERQQIRRSRAKAARAEQQARAW